MKKLFITLLCMGLFFTFNAGLFSQAESGTLHIRLIGFENDKGKAMVAICDSPESYKKEGEYFISAMADIKEKKAEAIFRDLPYGTYVVKAFHDENGNGKLDTGAFGIPKEEYGFSNNARGTFGPPKWEEASFTFKKSEMTIEITVK